MERVKKHQMQIIILVIAVLALIASIIGVVVFSQLQKKNNLAKTREKIKQEYLAQEELGEELQTKIDNNSIELTIKDIEDYKKDYKITSDKAEELENKLNDKISDEYKNIYTKEIESIQTKYPDFKVDRITGADKKKSVEFKGNLNVDKNEANLKCLELVTVNAKVLESIGTSNIVIYVRNNEGLLGIASFYYEDGVYMPLGGGM